QEGQQTETEATGAPQKHHYTLNQQVGSITDADSTSELIFLGSLPDALNIAAPGQSKILLAVA
ncbi:hypothetical protein M2U36_08125, partial [Klebsiella pneumoniae]|nr:hypothetical protein [Klebsiella pneumoniae]